MLVTEGSPALVHLPYSPVLAAHTELGITYIALVPLMTLRYLIYLLIYLLWISGSQHTSRTQKWFWFTLDKRKEE